MTTAPAGVEGCTHCRAPLAAGLAICPRCGEVQARVLPPAARNGGRRKLLVLLGVSGLLAAVLPLQLRRGPSVSGKCVGGERVIVDWRATDPATPRFHGTHLNQIDPQLTPHVKLAVLRHTGNAVYGDKCDHEFGHNHQAAVDAGHAAGGNAYFHAPARTIGPDQTEVTTTIALAHPGPIPRALRDRFFPSGQVVMVGHLIPGGVAERAGLKVNDVWVTINGEPVPTNDDAFEALTATVGDNGTMRLEVLRAGRLETITMVRPGKGLFGYHRIVAPVLDVTP